jgi:membrane protein
MPRWLGALTWKELVLRCWRQFHKDRILDQSATLSFYFLLSIFPLSLFLIDVLGLLVQSGHGIHETLHRYLTGVVPAPASGLIDRNLSQIVDGSRSIKFPLALFLGWLSGSQGVLALIEGLNVAYGVRERRRWWRKYLVAFLLTIVSLLLIAAGLMLLSYGDRLTEALIGLFGLNGLIARLWQVLEWTLFIGFVIVVFNAVYIFGPAVEHRKWRWLMPGTVVAVILWLSVSLLFKLYLNYFKYYSIIYGSIGAVIILMLWFYFFGIAILAGAVVNSEIEKSTQSVRSQDPH